MDLKLYDETGTNYLLDGEYGIHINYCGYGVRNFKTKLQECLGEKVKNDRTFYPIFKLINKDEFFKLLEGSLGKRSQGEIFAAIQSNSNFTVCLI